MQQNPGNTGSMNPYFQGKQAPPPYSNNYYQQYQRQPVQTNGRFSPMNSSAQRSTPTTTGVSPTITQEQRRRMEENRKRALAKRARSMNS